MGTQPFNGCYGEMPAYWLDAYQIITHNYNVASAAKNKQDEHKHKTEQQGVNPREVQA